MFLRWTLCLAMLVVISLGGGCATIFTGTSEDISFRSNPDKAEVFLNGSSRGTTPLTLKLKKKERYVVSMTHDGFQTQTYRLEQRIEPWFFGNIVIGGLVGMVIDVVSGGSNNIEPDELTMTLVPLLRGEAALPPSAVRLTPEEELAQLEQLYAHGSVEEKKYLSRKKKLERKIEREAKKNG